MLGEVTQFVEEITCDVILQLDSIMSQGEVLLSFRSLIFGELSFVLENPPMSFEGPKHLLSGCSPGTLWLFLPLLFSPSRA